MIAVHLIRSYSGSIRSAGLLSNKLSAFVIANVVAFDHFLLVIFITVDKVILRITALGLTRIVLIQIVRAIVVLHFFCGRLSLLLLLG